VLTRFGELNCVVVVVIIIDFILLLVKLINVKSEGLLQGNTLDQRGSADQELLTNYSILCGSQFSVTGTCLVADLSTIPQTWMTF